MSDRIEQQLERTLAGRAGVIGGPGFTPDQIIAAGRTAQARRHRMVVAGATAAVLAVAGAAAVLTATGLPGTSRPQPPATAPTRPTSEPSPTQAGSPPSGSVTAAAAGVDVIDNRRIAPADGAPFATNLPATEHVQSAVRVPDGYVIEAFSDVNGPALWFLRTGAEPERIADRLIGSYAVSPDGRSLVADGTENMDQTTAYELPSLRQLRSVSIDGDTSTVAVRGDLVLLKVTTGDRSPTRAHVWNLRTGAVRTTDWDIDIWGVSTDGDVLRRRFVELSSGPTACVDLVPIDAVTAASTTGYCGPEVARPELSGKISPDGDWVLMEIPGRAPELVRSADLRAGSWLPYSSGLPDATFPVSWAADGSYVGQVLDGIEGMPFPGYYQCRPIGSCRPLIMPTGFGPGVIPVADAGT